MADVDVRIHLAGVREVFAASGVTADLLRRGEAIARQADENVIALGYEETEHHEAKVVTSKKVGTPIVSIHGTTHEAHAAQSRHGTLTQALDAGRS